MQAGHHSDATGSVPPKPKARPSAFVIAAGLVAVAAVMLWDASRLADLGGYSGVGPASVPKVVACGLLALAAWTAFDGWRGRTPRAERQHLSPILWVVAGLVIQLLTLHLAGFSIATGILFAFTARAFGKTNLAMTIPLGIGLSFVVWLIFSQLLMLHLPEGPLEHAILSLVR